MLSLSEGHIPRFCSVFQVIQVISSAKLFLAEEVDISFNSVKTAPRTLPASLDLHLVDVWLRHESWQVARHYTVRFSVKLYMLSFYTALHKCSYFSWCHHGRIPHWTKWGVSPRLTTCQAFNLDLWQCRSKHFPRCLPPRCSWQLRYMTPSCQTWQPPGLRFEIFKVQHSVNLIHLHPI